MYFLAASANVRHYVGKVCSLLSLRADLLQHEKSAEVEANGQVCCIHVNDESYTVFLCVVDRAF